MRDQNAQTLLAKVMNWETEEDVISRVPSLQLLADYKYDHYQRFGPGRRFIESLALWLNQFDPKDRDTALDLVLGRLIYFSEAEPARRRRAGYLSLPCRRDPTSP